MHAISLLNKQQQQQNTKYFCLKKKSYNSFFKLLLQKIQKEALYSLSKSVGPVCRGLENGMTTQSSILAWRIPWAEKPGRLQSMGHKRVGHD